MVLPSEPIQSPGMASTTQTLPADYGMGPSGAILYTDGTATGTSSVGPEPMPGVHQAKATPKVGQAQISENLQKRYDAGVKVVTTVEPQFKTLFRLLDQTEAGAAPSATRAETIKVLRAKVLDPISVVREGEVFRFEGLLSLKDRGELILNQIATARDFTPEQARQVKEEMMGLYQDMKMWQAGEEAYYRLQADAMGVKFISRGDVNNAAPAEKLPTAKEIGLPAGWGEPEYRMVNGVRTLGTRGTDGKFYPLTKGGQ